MKIVTLEYSEYLNEDQEWKFLDCSFGDINLIVGKNAVGKTRTLNVVSGLGRLISKNEDLKYRSGKYKVDFINKDSKTTYILEYENNEIYNEKLIIDGEIKLNRDSTTTGTVYSTEFDSLMKFSVAPNRIAIISKRDAFQHPFIEDLYMWGKGIRKFNFGSSLGQDQLVIKGLLGSNIVENEFIDSNQHIVNIFQKGREKYETLFTDMVKADMEAVGYYLEEVGVSALPLMEIITENNQIINPPLGIFVKEKGLKAEVFQSSLSQGMFRALSLLIQINYSLLASEPTCIVIDDISEGLDFSRSSSLIKILIDKAKNASVQLIMATNDRFVMNIVPLEYWIILDRRGSQLFHYNYRNSKQMFDNFEATGLNNFDLFSTNYYSQSGKE